MAFKSGAERFDEALGTLLSLGAKNGEEIYKGYKGVLEWLGQQANPVAAKGVAGSQISVGGVFSDDHPMAKEIRRTLRALLLLLVTRYGLTQSELKAIKRKYDGSRSPAQLNEIVSSIKEKSSRIRNLSVLIDSKVYRHAGELGMPDVAQVLRAGRDSGSRVLGEAYAYMNSASDDKNFYSPWFGDWDAKGKNGEYGGKMYREVVKDKLKKVLDAYLSKSLSFTAEKYGSLNANVYATAVPQSYEDFIGRNYIEVDLGRHFFTSTSSHSSEIVRDDALFADVLERLFRLNGEEEAIESAYRKAVMDGDFHWADKEGPARLAYDRDARLRDVQERKDRNKERLPRDPPGRPKRISVTGVILHEATHQVVKTTDVKISGEAMYGPNYCRWLSKNHPDQALLNADSYRLFCEEFLLPRY
ncbi:hypothetical protein FAZ69_15700 [Trinickia terrae]|uniref:Lysine-specific metallo-endopeptidase domain-containing protein n=1 Tax=Trinickia terrae TaxID=2571161 RepID=A0A4U1I3A7_9BURK|nr:M35 family metallo-endopeptidase [Trinickia terrae]TKC87731.1 hypothetical protein FAZ69_15700 [Trinickia terrae]